MGTFGFGLTVATSSMGSEYEILSIKKGSADNKVSKIIFQQINWQLKILKRGQHLKSWLKVELFFQMLITELL